MLAQGEGQQTNLMEGVEKRQKFLYKGYMLFTDMEGENSEKACKYMRLGAQQGSLIAPCSISCVPGPLHISWVAESALQ